ncbi:MAG: glycosyltransferase family 4 protein [Nitrospirota bacterium]
MLWRRLVTRRADRIIVPSHYLKEEAVRNGICSDSVRVIPLFTGKNPGEEYSEPREKILLFAGRTDPLKGIGEFLAALGNLREYDWKAYIIGTSSLDEYEKMAADLEIRGRITFLTGVDYAGLDEYYRRASVVVFPSRSPESFGLVGIEAMSFGRPVIAYDSGGPREWLIDGETGLLIKRGDRALLSSSLLKLLHDRTLAERMGRHGMERVNMYFRKEHHVDELIDIYEEIAESRQ